MTVPDHASSGHLAALLSEASVEVSSRGTQLPELCDNFRPGTGVTITFLPGDNYRRNVETAAALRRAGFEVMKSEGTYFITASIRNLTNEPDRDFCKRVTIEAGVAPIPLSAFFGEGAPTDLVRFAFCKKHAVLEEAGRRLGAYFDKGKGSPG